MEWIFLPFYVVWFSLCIFMMNEKSTRRLIKFSNDLKGVQTKITPTTIKAYKVGAVVMMLFGFFHMIILLTVIFK